MKIGSAIAGLAMLLAGCSVSQTSAYPGTQDLAPQEVVKPFNLYKTNVIHKYPLPNAASAPKFMATGPDKNVWFTESKAKRIGKITPAGVITEYAISDFANDIAAGANGTLWFLEPNSNLVGKITTTGHVTEYPVALAGSYFFGGIAKGPDGNMWFTDANANSIEKITPTGTVTKYALPTNPDFPYDVVAGPDGNLWYSAAFGHVGKITTSGDITEYTGPSANVSSIAAGPDGNLYAEENNGIYKITTAGAITEFNGGAGSGDIILGPDKQMWLIYNNNMEEFNPKTQTFSKTLSLSTRAGGFTVGGDGDVWIADTGGNSILVYEDDLTTIGIRLNGELSITDPTYGFELGYAKGTGTTTQTISLSMGESVTFKNLDTIPHSAAFLGNATPSPSTWPATFTGSTTQSPAFTAIGTTGFATGSLNPNKSSPVYETGSPGFYMIGCQYHYVSDKMRTVVIVH